MIPISYYLFLSLALFSIGMIGVMTRRNIIIMLMCVELMLNSVNLLLVAFSKMHHAQNLGTDVGIDGQMLVLFIMVVAAAEVAIGLSIMILFYRKMYNVDVKSLNRLKH
ncbi:NADH-quinone oxidoreductase subunit NuoK [Moheibacter stercoris]|uniref:NADH-quinone oxidoreductase subunit K n=1 Tax=Moheibacter stercoris TaxID=1628251 RepID=A0ABV2LUP1_9FLAO